MAKIFILILFILPAVSYGQNTFRANVRDSLTREPLIGATAVLKGSTNGGVAGISGSLEIRDIPDGHQVIQISYIGYKLAELDLLFPLAHSQELIIGLIPEEQELDEIIISTTRTSRTIENVPTRVESIAFEEIDEKNNMRPANVAMLLHESTGIIVQQTSATSANASIRIQGLDGRYTQLLKDGYSNFGNFASGLSILEIPPLDLKQVEVIKGPASTLYGGGAIAGVINFISKTPGETGEYNFLINQSVIGQTNLGSFVSDRNKKLGYTFLALFNHQKPYDVDDDDFTELPALTDFTIFPKIFIYPTEKTTLWFGNSLTRGDRRGGDIEVIENKAGSGHIYFEDSKTLRNTSMAELDMKLKNKRQFTARSSFSYFDRNIGLPGYSFAGKNYNSFSDIIYSIDKENHIVVSGLNFVYDEFLETADPGFLKRDFTTRIGGLYAQHTWDISEKVKLESGLRADMAGYGNMIYRETEYFILPRVSVLFNFTDKLSSRIGGGAGYKTPTVFMEQTEAVQYRNIFPLDQVTSEKSLGATADLNFKSPIGEDFTLSINHMFFKTMIRNSIVLQSDSIGNILILNTKDPVISSGFETNLKMDYRDLVKIFVGYTFTEAKAEYLPGNQFLPLLPRHKINTAVFYELEKNLKIGFEAYYTGRQFLADGTRTPSFWELGAMVEKTFGKISIFLNAENFTDTRQSRYKSVANGPHSDPVFDDIWMHTEGFILNGGVKVRILK